MVEGRREGSVRRAGLAELGARSSAPGRPGSTRTRIDP